jgi:hypothetical protein
MPIGTAVQRGDTIYVYDEKGRMLCQFYASDGLKGYTSSTISVQNGDTLIIRDATGSVVNHVYAPVSKPASTNASFQSPGCTINVGQGPSSRHSPSVIGLILQGIGAIGLMIPSIYGMRINGSAGTKQGCGFLIIIIFTSAILLSRYPQILNLRSNTVPVAETTIKKAPPTSWSSKDGKIIEANFLGMRGNEVLLQVKSTGVTHAVPLDRLSLESQKHAKEAAMK